MKWDTIGRIARVRNTAISKVEVRLLATKIIANQLTFLDEWFKMRICREGRRK